MAKYAHKAKIVDGKVVKKKGYLYYVSKSGIVMETHMKRK